MYIDSYELYEFFDKHEDFATKVFKDDLPSRKPVVSCIITALEKVKYKNSLPYALKLDHFFTLCLEKRIKYIISKKPSIEDINEIKETVKEFFSLATKCENDILNHEVVYRRIQSLLSRY